MEFAEQSTSNLLTGVSSDLTKAGHPSTLESVNPDAESALEPIRRDFIHLIESNIETGFGGDSNTANDRNTKGRIAALIGSLRGLKKAA